MEKIKFCLDNEDVDLYILEQTKVNGINYILVTDSLEDNSEAFILKDVSGDSQQDMLLEAVEDDNELIALGKVFGELLEDVDLEV